MMKHLFRNILVIGFIGLFIYFYVKNPDSVTTIQKIGLLFFGVAIIYQLAILFISDLITKIMVDRLSEKRITILDGYYSAFISNFGNFFLPLTGGMFLRALFLKRQYNFSYKKFISISYGSYIVSFSVIFGIALFSLTYLYFKDNVFIPSLFFISLSVFILSISLMSKNLRLDTFIVKMLGKFKFGKKLAGMVRDISIGWQDIIHTPGLLLKMVALMLMNVFLRTIFYYVMFSSLGVTTNIFYMLLFTSLISISLYVTITPGSLGIREALLVFYSKSLNLDVSHVLTVNLIDRASSILVLIGLIIIFEFILKKRITDFFHRTKSNTAKL